MAKEQEKLHRGRFLGDLAQIAVPALVSRIARAVAGARLFDKVRPPFNVTVSSVRVARCLALLRRQPRDRDVPGRARWPRASA